MLRNERSINHKNPNVAQIRASRIGVTYLPISKVKLNPQEPSASQPATNPPDRAQHRGVRLQCPGTHRFKA